MPQFYTPDTIFDFWIQQQELKHLNLTFWSYAHIIVLDRFASQGVLNKDPTLWLDGSMELYLPIPS
jgi:hypothetical protein